MEDQRVGAAIRALRIRKRWRQIDLADRARVSAALVSAVERGRVGKVTLNSLRSIALALDARLDLLLRWQGGDLDRLINVRHNQMGEAVTAFLVGLGWQVMPEVSFSIYGERGVIDLLAWHAPSRTLLVIELKTEIVDPQGLLAVLGRKSRLALQVGHHQGWSPAAVATWSVIAEGSTNRARFARFGHLFGAALPTESRILLRWLRNPSGSVAGASFFSNFSHGGLMKSFATPMRVRRPSGASVERG